MYIVFTGTLYTWVYYIHRYNVYCIHRYIIYTSIMYTQVHYIHRYNVYTSTLYTQV